MKKSFAFLVIIILVFAMISCNATQVADTESNNAYCGTKEPIYIGANIDQYIADWQSAHNIQNPDNELYSTTYVEGKTSSLTVPVLQTTDYVLEEILVFYWSTNYFFTPTQNEESIHPLSKIRVYISDKLTYKDEAYFLFFEDGNIVYDPYHNVWRVHNGNATAQISFPEDIVLSSPEELSEYFTFETYTAGGGNDHVVS